MKTPPYWPPLLFMLCIVLCGQSPNLQQTPTATGRDAESVAWCQKAERFSEAGQFDSALVYAVGAAKMAEKAKDWYSWGKAQTTILFVRYAIGQYAEAASTFPSIEQKVRTVISADSSFWGDYYNAAGAIYNMLGNYEAALKYGLLEIAFDEKTGKQEYLAIACNNVGVYYRGRGDFDRALEYTQTALKVNLSRDNTNPADLAWTYGNLSKIWYRKKDYPKAIAYAEKALAILDRSCPDEHLLKIQTYVDLANACIEEQAYEKALTYLQKALRIHEQNNLDTQIEFTWYDLGYLYERMGRYPEAATYLKQAVDRSGIAHPLFSKACRHMGLVSRHGGDLRGALHWQQRALRALTDSFPYQDLLANPTPQKVSAYTEFFFCLNEKAETLHLLAEKESNPALLEATLATYDLATNVLDSMRAEYQEGSQQFWNQEARPIMENAIDLALQLYHDTGQPRYLEQAFRYAEKSKALLLAEALRASADKQQAGIPDALLQKEKQLKIDIAFYKWQIFQEQQKAHPDSSRVLLWQSEILQRRRAYDALLTELESGYPEYYRIKYNHPALTVAGLQQNLPEGTGLIEYVQGDRGAYIFYFDRSSALGLRLTTDSSFTAAFNRLLDCLRDRNRVVEQGRNAATVAQFAKDAAAVYRTLLAPVGKTIPERLLIIPDGRFAYLPFELLLTQEADTISNLSYSTLPYLLRQTAVRYEYSASLALQSPQGKSSNRFFAGYAPIYDGTPMAATTRGGRADCQGAGTTGFAPLGSNQAEVKQIAQLYSGQAFLAGEATESQFRQHAREPRILHLAMHGFLNDCDPLYSGLVFSHQATEENSSGTNPIAEENDGFLHAYEIYNLHLNAELVVLSACNTGHGLLAKGEGVISLARAFKYAGCANVLMSLWQADDQATAQIMQDFYRHMRRGIGKDAAIRQAKLDYIGASNRNHPFFWGAFVLIGDDRPIQKTSNWIWYGLAFLAVILGIIYWRVRHIPRAPGLGIFKKSRN